MKMARNVSTFFFFVYGLTLVVRAENELKEMDAAGIMNAVEQTLDLKYNEYAGYLTNCLETFNDNLLKDSEVGRMLHYEELKSKVDNIGKITEGRNIKKLAFATLPVIFHLGMTSAWTVLTTILTAKAVAIGLALLVFKIAASSAKVASYFTAWRVKDHGQNEYSFVPHHEHFEHHGHHRSLRDLVHHPVYQGQSSYSPSWNPVDGYDSGSSYKTIPFQGPYSEQEYAGTKKSLDNTLDEEKPCPKD
ncbi:uncharacterized protein LOC116413750 isoform X2 [Galleria mellonella]|uniref:Uncharacterized protein LOC116413750 isoform X2 n=1 Tax=Galleria mellonella TaxID=7137 RepID=A0A6J3CAB7_GALME|nr:uncharacterized protein LOC116413750 isoform X2 [Galleria mellonella]